ncbi:helix-turn-helix transcriptional regulator [Rhizobium sp. 007]|uniref:helix-turn-helix domain-containing protein n=1 Tax=Rhizobium sp. 007 TaxID=2785056 RepID=UPI00188F0976|nr:helix-turn-helix transcriptional regulator [Rhizobium sp. 007]QPB24576.1 helix-turn-helix transcriptional regulator [Rhizobium sp. 007]
MPDPVYAAVGEAIRRKREARAMSQASLAEKVSLARTSITNIEAGTQAIPLHNFLSIAQALAAEPGELLPPAETVKVKMAVSDAPQGFDQLLEKLSSDPSKGSK